MPSELYKRVMYYLTVPKCVCCKDTLEYTDRCFCAKCKIEYEEHKGRNCPRCSKTLNTCACSNKFMRAGGIKNVMKVYRYRAWERDIPSNRLIYSLKEQNRRDVFELTAEELSRAIKSSLKLDPDKFLITNIPRRAESINKFGYDHAAELAKRVAKLLGVRFVRTMRSRAKRAQKESIGNERIKNASFTLRSACKEEIKGKTVVIIDDIITTGSSMVAAARLLRANGARRTLAGAIAIAYKDE